MKLYNIYEIPSFIQPDGSIGKVGCTSMTVEARALQQTYTDVILLEQHTDIMVASAREIELQTERGYRVDDMPYWQSVQNRYKWDSTSASEAGKIGGCIGGLNTSPIPGLASKGVPRRSIRKLTFEQAEEIRSKYIPRKYSLSKLGEEYGVDLSTIHNIVKNITYTKA